MKFQRDRTRIKNVRFVSTFKGGRGEEKSIEKIEMESRSRRKLRQMGMCPPCRNIKATATGHWKPV